MLTPPCVLFYRVLWVAERQMIDCLISELHQGRKESCIIIWRDQFYVYGSKCLAAGNKHVTVEAGKRHFMSVKVVHLVLTQTEWFLQNTIVISYFSLPHMLFFLFYG